MAKRLRTGPALARTSTRLTQSTRKERTVSVGAQTTDASAVPFAVGHGFDLHRLESKANDPSLRLVVGGVELEHDKGCVAHSDGDVVLHCVCDAILGAISQPDIGQLFPDSDPQWQAATSDVFVKEAVRIASEMEYEVCNIDVTLIAQQPKMAPHKESMRMNVASFLDVPLGRVNVKAKTHEKVDSLGENRSIACHTVALLAHSNVMHMLQLS